MRIAIIAGAGLLSAGTIAQGEPLPFADGRYLSDPALCSLTDDQLVARVGDDIYKTLIELDGNTLNEGYGAYCDVGAVTSQGSAVNFEAACDVEGETNAVQFSYQAASPTAFRVGGTTYTRCD